MKLYLCKMDNQEIISIGPNKYRELITVWEDSVRATHHFLSESDIQHYKSLILNQYLDQLQLFGIQQRGQIAGFIGLNGAAIQMLFISPQLRGLGIGKTLVRFAIESHAARNVDVNEQNRQAVEFYKYLGFVTAERYEEDAAGKPYPILSMTIDRDAVNH